MEYLLTKERISRALKAITLKLLEIENQSIKIGKRTPEAWYLLRNKQAKYYKQLDFIIESENKTDY